MKDATDAVLQFASNHTFEDFEQDSWDQAAVLRNLEVIGEAATHIPEEIRRENSLIPWRDIIDFRNVAIHEYMEVDMHIVWDIIQSELPHLKDHVEKMIAA
ncbi:DUF86 domain-containing protein [Candidatus Woesebacteria bacterium]|nr:DUF86 domain-containing protein [Candidatus Woesebacteria bacterium]